MAKYIIDIPDEVPVSDELVPFDMCRPSWYWEAYEKGKADTENEVWSFAWKIFSMDLGEYAEIFDDKGSPSDYREAKAKYEAWKAEKAEIRVGDEIEAEPGKKACVLYENPGGTQLFVFKADGTFAWWSKCTIHKTGKNHPEFAELLKKMRDEE